MKKRNKVFSIIFSTILGIQSMGLPSVFAEMSLDEKEIFSRIESKRHDPKYKNYEKIIDFINCMKYKGKSLDFKLYCLSMLFRLGAKANDINEFITKNGIDLDDTSNPYYIYIIYRSLYYRIEVLPKVGINEELN